MVDFGIRLLQFIVPRPSSKLSKFIQHNSTVRSLTGGPSEGWDIEKIWYLDPWVHPGSAPAGIARVYITASV